jgi:hypothetical protein
VDAIYLINAVTLRAENQAELSICYPYVKHATEQPLEGQIDIACHADTPVTLSCYSPQNATVIQAQGPDNPSTSMIDYLIARSREPQVTMVFVTDFSGENHAKISAIGDNIRVTDMRLNRDYRL